MTTEEEEDLERFMGGRRHGSSAAASSVACGEVESAAPRTLADMILAKIREKQRAQAAAAGSDDGTGMQVEQNEEEAVRAHFPPKVIEVYRQ